MLWKSSAIRLLPNRGRDVLFRLLGGGVVIHGDDLAVGSREGARIVNGGCYWLSGPRSPAGRLDSKRQCALSQNAEPGVLTVRVFPQLRQVDRAWETVIDGSMQNRAGTLGFRCVVDARSN